MKKIVGEAWQPDSKEKLIAELNSFDKQTRDALIFTWLQFDDDYIREKTRLESNYLEAIPFIAHAYRERARSVKLALIGEYITPSDENAERIIYRDFKKIRENLALLTSITSSLTMDLIRSINTIIKDWDSLSLVTLLEDVEKQQASRKLQAGSEFRKSASVAESSGAGPAVGSRSTVSDVTPKLKSAWVPASMLPDDVAERRRALDNERKKKKKANETPEEKAARQKHEADWRRERRRQLKPKVP